MASSLLRDSAAAKLLRDLVGAEELVARLDETAPEACRRHGGAHAMLAGFGGHPTCIGFWRLDFGASPQGIALWEAMAGEQQAAHRGNWGEE